MDFSERDNQTAVAPDGSMIAYVAALAGEAPRLLLKRLDAASSQVIGDAVDVRDPFFSPDGRWIGFFSGDTLRKVSVADGRSQVVCHAPRGESGAWDHGFIVFGETGDLTKAGIRRVPENGGEAEVISTPQRDAGERSHQAPQLLPDGRTVMYTVTGRNSKGAIRRVVVQPPGAPARVLLENASYGRLVGDSVLVYQRGNSLYATRLELETLSTSGDGVMLFNDLSPSIRPLWAAGGEVLAYRPRNLNVRFVWVDRQGREASLPSPLRPYRAPSLSPRADRIAVQVAEEDKSDVWMLDVEQQRLTPLTNDGNSEYPMWTPDGGRVGFARRRDDTSDFFVVTPQGTEPRLIKRGDMRMWIGSWMPDMRGIVVHAGRHPDAKRSLARRPPDAGSTPLGSQDGRSRVTADACRLTDAGSPTSPTKRVRTSSSCMWPRCRRARRDIGSRRSGHVKPCGRGTVASCSTGMAGR